MNRIENIDKLDEGLFICIDIDNEYVYGYILDIVSTEDGIMTIILSHDGDFEEDTIDIVYHPRTGTVESPDMYLIS